MRHEQNSCEKLSGPFFKTNKVSTKNAGIYSHNPVGKSESKNCEYSFLWRKAEGKPTGAPPMRSVPLVVRVSEFGNHWSMWIG